MKQSTIFVASVGLLALMCLGEGKADGPIGPVLRAKLTDKQPYLAMKIAHLKLTAFSGVLEGRNYLLGGSVTNTGPGDRGRSQTKVGGSKGRKLELYLVNYKGKDAVGRTLLRTLSVPAIKADGTWTIPTIVIPTRQVPGSATAQFQLFLTPGDGDKYYDWRIIWVSPVR